MTDNQVVCMSMQTCQEYAQKMTHTPLTEYEMKCYEACCEHVRMYCKLMNVNIQANLLNYYRENPDVAKEDGVDIPGEGSDDSGEPAR